MEGFCLPLVQDFFHCLIARGRPSEGFLSGNSMKLRASSGYGLEPGFRLLIFLGRDRYPSTMIKVGRRKGCFEDRRVPGTQVLFI